MNTGRLLKSVFHTSPGFTLVEVLVGVGLVSSLFLAITSVLQFSMNSQKSNSNRLDVNSNYLSLMPILSRSQTCKSAFRTATDAIVSLDTTINANTSVDRIMDLQGNKTVYVGQSFGGVSIGQIVLKTQSKVDPSATIYLASLQLSYSLTNPTQPVVGGLPRNSEPILLSITVDPGSVPPNQITDCTAAGASASGWLEDSKFNLKAGAGALALNSSGTYNVVAGSQALANSTLSNYNVAIGNLALQEMVPPLNGYNVAVGSQAMKGSSTPANNTGKHNTATGAFALYSTTSGSENTAVGKEALYSNTTGVNNVAVGNGALYLNDLGDLNVAVGYSALYANTSGSWNTAIGYQALTNNTDGMLNIGIGFGALANNTSGFGNISVGNNLTSNTFGTSNIAIGGLSLNSNTTGNANIALGTGVLAQNTTGYDNIAIGEGALPAVTTGNGNIAMGKATLGMNMTGTHNIGIGALNDGVQSGSYNTFVGAHTFGTLSTTCATCDYQTVIGADAKNTHGANSIVIGRASDTTYVETLTVKDLTVTGTYSPPSDARFKINVEPITDALDIIDQLQGVRFDWNRERFPEKGFSKAHQIGFIAQQVEPWVPEAVSTDKEGYKGMDYSKLVALLNEGIKELHAKTAALEAENQALKTWACKKDPEAPFCSPSH